MPVALGHVDDHDRARHEDTGGHVDHDGLGHEGVVEGDEGVGRLVERQRRAASRGRRRAAPDGHALGAASPTSTAVTRPLRTMTVAARPATASTSACGLVGQRRRCRGGRRGRRKASRSRSSMRL